MLRSTLLLALFLRTSVASPPLPSLPTTVFVHYLFHDIEGPDATSGTFFADIYVSTAWQAPALAGFAAAGVNVDMVGNFTPMIEIANARDGVGLATALQWQCWWGFPTWIGSETATPAAGSTWVNCQTRVSGAFSVPCDVHSFPQDKQVLFIEVQSSAYTADQVALVPVAGLSEKAIPEDLHVLGWNREGVSVVSTTKTFEAWNQDYSIVAVAVKLQRDSGYYMTRVVTNIILLEFMAFFFAFLSAEDPIRLLGNLTVFATVVAWVFIILLDVPTVSYMTRLDSFLIASFACIFAMAILHGCNYMYLAGFQRKEEEEERVEKKQQLRADIELAEAVASARVGTPTPRSPGSGRGAAPPSAAPDGGGGSELGGVAGVQDDGGVAVRPLTREQVSVGFRGGGRGGGADGVVRGAGGSVRSPRPRQARSVLSMWAHFVAFTRVVLTRDRQADVAGTLVVAVVYAVVVAIIFGRDPSSPVLAV